MATLIKAPKIGDAFVLRSPQAAVMPPVAASPPIATRPDRPVQADPPAAAEVPVDVVSSAPASAPAIDDGAERRQALVDARREAERREHRVALKALEDKAEQQGYANGLAKGEATYAEAIDTLARVKTTLDLACENVLADAERLIGAIVFESVCKIVGPRLLTEDGCRAVVGEVLARARREDVVSVRLTPIDLARISAAASRVDAGSADGLANLHLEADDSVEMGGCIVQLKGGSIDGRIESQFRALAQGLKDAARRR